MKNLNSNEFQQAIEQDENAVIIDVRTPGECAGGVIQGAINLNLFEAQKFKDAVSEMDKSKNYYIYCRSGNRSGQACHYMSSQGFENTFNLAGGIIDWKGPVAAYEQA